MSLFSCRIIFWMFVVLFNVSIVASYAVAQQDVNNKQQQIMSPVSGPSGAEIFISNLNLKMYDGAAAKDASVCGNNEECAKEVKNMEYLICVVDACETTEKNTEPMGCAKEMFANYTQEEKGPINGTICSWMKYPNTETRQAFLKYLPKDIHEDDLVELEADSWALKGSSAPCEQHIKNYFGAYGPQWTQAWYRAMSGCRILAHERTREQEEQDFSAWYGVKGGSASARIS